MRSILSIKTTLKAVQLQAQHRKGEIKPPSGHPSSLINPGMQHPGIQQHSSMPHQQQHPGGQHHPMIQLPSNRLPPGHLQLQQQQPQQRPQDRQRQSGI